MEAILIPLGLLVAVPAGLVVAGLAEQREQRRRTAADTWRGVVLRNGVSEVLPWHGERAPINAPGIVEVRPAVSQPVSQPVSVVNPDELTVLAVPNLPEPVEKPLSEREMVRDLLEQGYTQGDTIERVFGVKKGGSQRYKNALAIVRQVRAELEAENNV